MLVRAHWWMPIHSIFHVRCWSFYGSLVSERALNPLKKRRKQHKHIHRLHQNNFVPLGFIYVHTYTIIKEPFIWFFHCCYQFLNEQLFFNNWYFGYGAQKNNTLLLYLMSTAWELICICMCSLIFPTNLPQRTVVCREKKKKKKIRCCLWEMNFHFTMIYDKMTFFID